MRGLPYLLFVSHLCQQRGGGAGLQRSLQIGLNTFQLADFFLPLGLPIGIQRQLPRPYSRHGQRQRHRPQQHANNARQVLQKLEQQV